MWKSSPNANGPGVTITQGRVHTKEIMQNEIHTTKKAVISHSKAWFCFTRTTIYKEIHYSTVFYHLKQAYIPKMVPCFQEDLGYVFQTSALHTAGSNTLKVTGERDWKAFIDMAMGSLF